MPRDGEPQLNGCPHVEGCPFREMLDKDPKVIDRVYGLAQQIRYLHRTSSALAGLMAGVMETIEMGGELDGTARVSIATLDAALTLANRVKDKSAVAGQVVRLIGYLKNVRLWEQLDDRE